mmetsp:Transcript_1861/g.2929  ORF Transcript_1861/g.2929 Transcript_1861/m.2929 type:complete len:115 (-) Transcript_1861:169-513(-)
MKLTIHTFQITVSDTHSCNALVMQLIFNGLHNRGVELSEMIHHAVLPSFDLADNFRFKSGENLEPSTRILCNAVAPSAKKKRGIIFIARMMTKGSRKKMWISSRNPPFCEPLSR